MRRPSDLQIYYQRNLLCGLLFSLALSIVAGIWISRLDGNDFRSQLPVHEAGSAVAEDDRNPLADNDNQRYYRNLHPYYRRHDGFLGFVKLQPVAQNLPVSVTRPSDLSTKELDPEISQEEAELWTSVGGAVDLVLSSGDYYDLGTSKMAPNHNLADRDVEVFRRPDPEYPLFARDAAKEGKITVLVFIDSVGELSTFPDWLDGEGIKTLECQVNGERKMFQYALKEEPKGWFFAENFLKVLPMWTFTPKIESGISVSSLLRIKFYYCLGLNCMRLELEHVES